MAPSQPRQSKAVAVPLDGSESEESQDSSPEAQVDLLKSAQNIVTNNKKRRDTKRKAIEGEHEQRVKTTRAKIDALFDAKKSRVTKSQSVLWERLDALNKRRQDLEGRILASMKTIETQTGNISREVAAIFAGRVEDIEEPSQER